MAARSEGKAKDSWLDEGDPVALPGCPAGLEAGRRDHSRARGDQLVDLPFALPSTTAPTEAPVQTGYYSSHSFKPE